MAKTTLLTAAQKKLMHNKIKGAPYKPAMVDTGAPAKKDVTPKSVK